MDMSSKPIAVLGAGAWGTALAIHLARRGAPVRLLSMAPAEIAALTKERCNERFLPGFTFTDNIQPIDDLTQAIASVDTALIAMPSVAFRSTLSALHKAQTAALRIISAAKGLEASTGQLLHTVIKDELGKDTALAVLSGPSFAKEVAANLPTSLMIASHDQKLIEDVQHLFTTNTMHIFPTNDIVGVEIGAIVKNIVAIAVGIADGLQLGANARSAIITQGLNDMIHLGESLGARHETLVGLAGAGDLILTCTDNQSRNRQFGLALGAGKSVAQAEQAIGHVVEVKSNLQLALNLAEKQNVQLITAQAISALLNGNITANAALEQILAG